jgi:osmoprotectant transport system permease protein
MLIMGYTDLKVITKTGLGGTKICFDALTNGEIDCYPEYTGTGLLVMLQPGASVLSSIMSSKSKVYDYVQQEFNKRFDISWLKPIGFNNAYALMMRRQQAHDMKILTITDLKKQVDQQQ